MQWEVRSVLFIHDSNNGNDLDQEDSPAGGDLERPCPGGGCSGGPHLSKVRGAVGPSSRAEQGTQSRRHGPCVVTTHLHRIQAFGHTPKCVHFFQVPVFSTLGTCCFTNWNLTLSPRAEAPVGLPPQPFSDCGGSGPRSPAARSPPGPRPPLPEAGPQALEAPTEPGFFHTQHEVLLQPEGARAGRQPAIPPPPSGRRSSRGPWLSPTRALRPLGRAAPGRPGFALVLKRQAPADGLPWTPAHSGFLLLLPATAPCTGRC